MGKTCRAPQITLTQKAHTAVSYTLARSSSSHLHYGKADKNRFPPATLDIAPPIYAVSATPTLLAKIVYKAACIASQDRSFQYCARRRSSVPTSRTGKTIGISTSALDRQPTRLPPGKSPNLLPGRHCQTATIDRRESRLLTFPDIDSQQVS